MLFLFAFLPVRQRNIGLPFGNAFVSGTDDLTVVGQLFDAVCAPAGHAGHGEHGSEKLGRQIQHAVDEAAVEIHVGADAFVDFSLLADDDRSQALHVGVETKFFLAAFFGSQAVDEGFENIGTGVGDGVDGSIKPTPCFFCQCKTSYSTPRSERL